MKANVLVLEYRFYNRKALEKLAMCQDEYAEMDKRERLWIGDSVYVYNEDKSQVVHYYHHPRNESQRMIDRNRNRLKYRNHNTGKVVDLVATTLNDVIEVSCGWQDTLFWVGNHLFRHHCHNGFSTIREYWVNDE